MVPEKTSLDEYEYVGGAKYATDCAPVARRIREAADAEAKAAYDKCLSDGQKA